MRKVIFLFICPILLLTISNCRTATLAERNERKFGRLTRYFPLALGNTWVYKTLDRNKSLAPISYETIKITRYNKGKYYDNMKNEYTYRKGLIYKGVLVILKFPILEYHRWEKKMWWGGARKSFPFNHRTQIVKLHSKLKVRKMLFNDCVETWSYEFPSIRSRKYYCKDIGLVKEVWFGFKNRKRFAFTIKTIISYTIK